MTCPRLDLAQDCRSVRLARKRGLPREPRGKGSAPCPPTFCPALTPRSSAHWGAGRRRGLSGGFPAPADRPRAPLLTLPCEHMFSHALLPGEAGSGRACGLPCGRQTRAWRGGRPWRRRRPGSPAWAPGESRFAYRRPLGGSEFFRLSKSVRQMPSPQLAPGNRTTVTGQGPGEGRGDESLGSRNPELRWD